MFNLIESYLKGYVEIEVIGFSITKFLNLSISENIVFSNIHESKNGIICNVDIKNFKKLRKFSKKTGCKYKIVSKYGLPFFISLNKKRSVLLLSAILFIFLLYFFASFIWSINIVGSDIVDNNKILEFCEENNFHIGSYKRNLNPKQLQTDIKNHFNQISWVSVQIKGTAVNIKVSENLPNENIVDSLEPCDIIATETGIISNIVTRSGTPLVIAKDTVQKGDILVSGEIFLKEGEEIKDSYITYSDADIKAKVEKDFNVSVPFKYYIKEHTGKTKTNYNFTFFNKSFNFFKPNINYKYYDKFKSIKQLSIRKDYPLPFIIEKTTYKEYNKVEKTYSIEEANIYANKLITEKIIAEISFASDIIDKKISYTETEEGLNSNVKLSVIESIGEKVPVKITYTKVDENNEETNTTNTN